MKNKPMLLFNGALSLAALAAFFVFLPRIRSAFNAFYGDEADATGTAAGPAGQSVLSPLWFIWLPLLVLCGAGVMVLGFILPRRAHQRATVALGMRGGAIVIAAVFVFLLLKLFAPLLDAAKKLATE